MSKKFFSKYKNHKNAFSLVVALVMMAMMLLIAISLVSFVVLETQISSYRIRRHQAQTNAISGLRIALAQLQLLAGDDQRVTATADILGNGGGKNKSLPAGTPYKGKKHWTGVWATGNLNKNDPDKLQDWDYATPDQKPFLGWLVSNYDSEAGRFSPLTNPINKQTAAITEKTLISKATTAYDVEDDSNELITLVGAGTLGKSTGWEDEVVKVRRVPIEKITDYQQPLKTSGSFAYWVGDEGVKARVNLPDNYDENVSKIDEWYRNFRSTPQRLGTEIIKAFEDLPEAWKKDLASAGDPGTTKLPYVTTIGDLAQYLEKNEASDLRDFKKYYHDVTFHSRGVLSDTYNGGLKTDLSVAFEMPWKAGNDFEKGFRDYPQFHGSGDKNMMNLLGHFTIPNDNTTSWWLEQPTDGLGFVYEFDTKNNGSQIYDSGSGFNRPLSKSVNLLRGPTWDVFRNYYRFYKKELETTGHRGFKPASKDSFTAIGMRPYSYVDGLEGRFSTNSIEITAENDTTIVYNGYFTPKGAPALMTRQGGSKNDNTNRRVKTPIIDGDQLIIPQAMRLSPVILRYIFRISLIFNQDTYALAFDPMMVVYNPYNVPIEFFGIGTYYYRFNPFQIRLRRTDGGKWKLKDRDDTEVYHINTFKNQNADGSNRIYVFRWFAGTNSIQRAPSGTIRLQPGEVKSVFPSSKERPKPFDNKTYILTNLGKTTFEQGSVSGFFLDDIKGYDGTPESLTEEVKADLQSAVFEVDYGAETNKTGTWADYDIYAFNLFFPVGSNGQQLTDTKALTRCWRINFANTQYTDVSDEHFIQAFGSSKVCMFENQIRNFNGKEFSASGGTGWDANVIKQPIADIHIYKAPARYTPLASPLLTNIRPWVCDPRNFKTSNYLVSQGTEKKNFATCGVGWVTETMPSKNEFSPIENVGGNAFWGDDITSSQGQTNIVLFEIPTQPMTSLGQFQSVDASWCEQDTSYIVGNSYPPIALKLEERNSGIKAIYSDEKILEEGRQPDADHSFAANLAIWDRYWFSTINVGDIDGQVKRITTFANNIVDDKENCLPNKRVEFIRSRSNLKRKASDIEKDFQNPNKVTRNFYYTGMFNINSTSKEAWKALLGSLHEQYLKIDGEFSKVKDFPIIRFANIIGQKLGGYVGGAGTQSKINDSFGNEGEGWRWYRSLDEKEIDDLAEQIVEEVRSRGPFMSLADFVNRRAYSENLEQARSGALQAAIDKTKNLNSGNDISENTPDTNDYKNLIPDNSNASGRAGAPGYLSQGDILSCLGSGMSARSDTFTVRAYGDIVGLDGNPIAKAYCEAIVQRTPEWFVDEEEETLYSEDNYTFDSLVFKRNYRNEKPDERHAFFSKFQRNTNLQALNRLLGRRFKIVSFRWLTPDEI